MCLDSSVTMTLASQAPSWAQEAFAERCVDGCSRWGRGHAVGRDIWLGTQCGRKNRGRATTDV